MKRRWAWTAGGFVVLLVCFALIALTWKRPVSALEAEVVRIARSHGMRPLSAEIVDDFGYKRSDGVQVALGSSEIGVVGWQRLCREVDGLQRRFNCAYSRSSVSQSSDGERKELRSYTIEDGPDEYTLDLTYNSENGSVRTAVFLRGQAKGVGERVRDWFRSLIGP